MATFTANQAFDNNELWVGSTANSTNETFEGFVSDTGPILLGLLGERTIKYSEFSFTGDDGLTYRYIGDWTIYTNRGLLTSETDVYGTYSQIIVEDGGGNVIATWSGNPIPVTFLDRDGLTLVDVVGGVLNVVIDLLFGPGSDPNAAYANMHTVATPNLPALAFSNADTITGSSGNDILRGYAGDDLINGNGGADLLIGGGGNDVYNAFSTSDVVQEDAAAGSDLVRAFNTNYTLQANVKSLVMFGGANFTGNGNSLDNFIGSFGVGNILNGLDGNDTMDVFGINSVLNGGNGNDWLVAHGAGSLVNGDAGEDLLFAEGGSINLYGGAGNDAYFINSTTSFANEDPGNGEDIVRTYGVGYTLGANLENLVIAAGNNLTGVGNSGNNFVGSLGTGITLQGGDGNDFMDALGANSAVFGENGNDNIAIRAAGSSASGGLGDDTLTGTASGVNLHGDEGNDLLVATTSGVNMFGGQGNDTYFVVSSTDNIEEGAGQGNDLVRAFDTNYTLQSQVEALIMATGTNHTGTGNSGDNYMASQGANNTLFGMDGNNSLVALAANNILSGGNGNDQLYSQAAGTVMTGGAGNDLFYFGAGNGAASVTDYTDGQDAIAFQSSQFANFAAVQAAASQVGANVVITSGSDVYTLQNVTLASLSSGDFLFV